MLFNTLAYAEFFGTVFVVSWLLARFRKLRVGFLLAASYTLQRNDHIRIDIVSGMLPKWVRNWIDLLGHILMLVPFVILMKSDNATLHVILIPPEWPPPDGLPL